MRKLLVGLLMVVMIVSFGCAKKQTRDVVTTDIMKFVMPGEVKDQLVENSVKLSDVNEKIVNKYSLDNFQFYRIIKKAYPNCKLEKVSSYAFKKAYKDLSGNITVYKFQVTGVPVTLKVNPVIEFVLDNKGNLVAIYVKK